MEEASAGLQSFQYSDLIRYRAGKTTDVQWFGTFDRPRINRSQPMPQRTGDTMSVTAPGWGDGEENHAGTVGPGTISQQIRLYRGNEQIAENDGPQLTADVPAGKAQYRLVTATQRTEYPYAVPTRTDGTTTRNASLLVAPSHIPGVSVASVRTDRVDLSNDDGKTWTAPHSVTRRQGPPPGCTPRPARPA
ncbi:hypothetical protein [Streptomyces sp. NPDC088358]|uniref:hypothetical protein n=1 Tax=Streptomyces sp. NPDC088358 TaxID=3365857 RepID=UPI003830DBE2